MSKLKANAIDLLMQLVATPSLSRYENATADLIASHLEAHGIDVCRSANNVWCKLEQDEAVPTVLLNSHHDTVKPCAGWLQDPFSPTLNSSKMIGLGANDAGASLVSLMATFLHFSTQETTLPFNLIFAATAEEEISGENGVESILPALGKVDLGIVGEPTQMQMAVAERGLMVLDCTAYGVAGHAARKEGENAIYKAMDDVRWFQNYAFEKCSELLGEVQLAVTQVEAGTQHNVVPDRCAFVVDVRSNELYTNEQLLQEIRAAVKCELTPRSVRLNASGIAPNHPVITLANELGIKCFGSPTLSDQALMPFPTIKIGPGDSARSHTANEYILIKEIEQGIDTYIELLSKLNLK